MRKLAPMATVELLDAAMAQFFSQRAGGEGAFAAEGAFAELQQHAQCFASELKLLGGEAHVAELLQLVASSDDGGPGCNLTASAKRAVGAIGAAWAKYAKAHEKVSWAAAT